MMKHGYLSPDQRRWLLIGLGVSVLLGALGLFAGRAGTHDASDTRFATDMNLKQLATALGTTGKGLARELDLPLDIPKDKPIAELGVSQEQLDHAAEHVLSHEPTTSKYYLFAALVFFGLVYLTRVGRPGNGDASSRERWYPRFPYIAALLVSVAVCGFAMGKSPNPMEGAVKLFKSMVGLYPSVTPKAVAFLFFIALAVIGNKLICGLACPFGALQELVYSLPLLRAAKRWKPPFWLMNSIRIVLFIAALLLLFGILGSKQGFVVYHGLNPFNLFDLDFDQWTILATIVVALLLSLVVYRPFCYLVCPFGLLSWLAERLSCFRVQIDHEACTECGACARACPSDAAAGRVKGTLLAADCFSCARCLNVCAQDAIRYGAARPRASDGRPDR